MTNVFKMEVKNIMNCRTILIECDSEYNIVDIKRRAGLDELVEKVVFNDPITIVFWKDGTKTVSKASNEDRFDKETGLVMAIIRKFCGSKNYGKFFEKYCG